MELWGLGGKVGKKRRLLSFFVADLETFGVGRIRWLWLTREIFQQLVGCIESIDWTRMKAFARKQAAGSLVTPAPWSTFWECSSSF